MKHKKIIRFLQNLKLPDFENEEHKKKLLQNLIQKQSRMEKHECAKKSLLRRWWQKKIVLPQPVAIGLIILFLLLSCLVLRPNEQPDSSRPAPAPALVSEVRSQVRSCPDFVHMTLYLPGKGQVYEIQNYCSKSKSHSGG